MRALPEGLAVQPRQDPGGKCRSRFQQDRKRLAFQLASPAPGLDPVAQRQLKPVIARTGKRLPQCSIGDRAVRLGRTTQAVEINGIPLEVLCRSTQRLGNEDIPVARRAEQRRQPFCLGSSAPELSAIPTRGAAAPMRSAGDAARPAFDGHPRGPVHPPPLPGSPGDDAGRHQGAQRRCHRRCAQR